VLPVLFLWRAPDLYIVVVFAGFVRFVPGSPNKTARTYCRDADSSSALCSSFESSSRCAPAKPGSPPLPPFAQAVLRDERSA
jgi:hypothetical protein